MAQLEKAEVSKISDSDCKVWSENNAKQVSSSSHNHTVGILRRIFKIAIEAGARYDNPALAAIWIKEHTFHLAHPDLALPRLQMLAIGAFEVQAVIGTNSD